MRLIVLVAALIAAAPLLAHALVPVSVLQKNREFLTQELALPPGSVVRFENVDAYPHQINVSGPGMAYDSNLQDPGERIDIPFPTRGTFQVRCGVHPRMRLTVRVGQTP